MLSDKVKEVAGIIGQYYLNKNNGDYEKTEKEITDLHITKIEVSQIELNTPTTITITAERIGLLIGKRGTNIDALEKFLNEGQGWWKSVKIHMVEDTDNLLYYLIPMAPEDFDHYL